MSPLTVRKHLSAGRLSATLAARFATVSDPRPGDTRISMADALMSAYAMFALKDPSLLAFDERRQDDAEENLHSLYKIDKVPSDTQMRVILDPVSTDDTFQTAFREPQRGKSGVLSAV